MTEIKPRRLQDLKPEEPFKSLFSNKTPESKVIFTRILKDMRTNGFDECQPIIVWRGKDIIIAGHTRREVALAANKEWVPVIEKDFASEEEAVKYAIHLQRDRRNLSDGDILQLVELLTETGIPERYRQITTNVANPPKEERVKVPKNEAVFQIDGNGHEELITLVRNIHKAGREALKNIGRSSNIVADFIGINRGKVEKCLTILEKGSAGIKNRVLANRLTIKRAYTVIVNNDREGKDVEGDKGTVSPRTPKI